MSEYPAGISSWAIATSERHRNPKNACRNKFSHQIQQAEEFQHQ